MLLSDLVARVRLEVGDPLTPFRTTTLADGTTTWFNLPNQQINTLSVAVVNGASYTTYTDFTAALPWSSTTAYTSGTQVTWNGDFFTAAQNSTNQSPAMGGNAYWNDETVVAFTQDAQLGQVTLGSPPANNSTIIMSGNSYSLFSEDELNDYALDAVREHCYNRHITERFYDSMGRITYRETPVNLSNLPRIEEPLVAMLAIINTFWVLANDTATDFNVQTAEGTNIDRTTQYRNITNQIGLMQARYDDFCGQLNVGLHRTEVFTLRRQSYTTGRLVPVFEPQEYDDHRWPTRLLPEIDGRNADNSGLPNPLWNGMWGG